MITRSDDPDDNRVLTGSLRRRMLTLALPVLVEQLLSFSVGMVDTFLARTDSNATTAVGLAVYVGWLASLLISLVATGTTALVSRHWGANDREAANRFANRSMAMAGCLGMAIFAFVYLAAPIFASMQEMSGETARLVIRYLRLDGCGLIFTSLILVGAAAMRGTGDMRSPMVILGIVNILNAIVSTILVYGLGPFPAWGMDGIVAGTVTARVSGGVLMLLRLARGSKGLQLHRRELVVRGEEAGRILRIGIPAAVEGIVMWAGNFLFLMIIARLGQEGFSKAHYAAHIIGIRVEGLTYLPAVAWGHAAATMVGQALGAGDVQRARQAGHEAVMQCGLLATAMSLLYFFGAPWIYAALQTETAVHEIGIPAFRMLSLVQVPLVLTIIYMMALHGAGDTRYPMWFTFVGVICVRVPLGYLCGIILDGGLIGAWVGMCGDILLRAVLLQIRFTRGRWVETRV